MSPFQFLKQLNLIPPFGGDGIRRKIDVPVTSIKTSAGLTLTAATTPTIVNVDTNAIGIVAAASTTASGSFIFTVPGDYDSVADELKFLVTAAMGGATNTPTLTVTAYSRRPGSALGSALTAVASAAVSATSAVKTISLTAPALRAGDIVTVNLVSGAHTTDALNIYGVQIQYKGGIVLASPSDR